MNKKINIATCQFAVSGDIKANLKWMRLFIKEAAKQDANVVHFPECSLSGYASVDYDSLDGFDWNLLDECSADINALAKEVGIYVIYGRNRKADNQEKPFNSLYVVNPKGKVECIYDKRFCTVADKKFYQLGDKFVSFKINGVLCSALICYDLRFPELYRELKKMGVECIFQSFYNARQSEPSIHTDIMRQTMQCRAATNYFWVSMSNSSAPISPYPSAFIKPDGKTVKELWFDKSGIMVNTADTTTQYYDASAPFRDDAINGKLNN